MLWVSHGLFNVLTHLVSLPQQLGEAMPQEASEESWWWVCGRSRMQFYSSLDNSIITDVSLNMYIFLRGCSAKRRRLMVEAEVDISENSVCPPPAQQASPALPQTCPAPLPQSSSVPSRPETDALCMEIEAAQRRLQEIEDRCVIVLQFPRETLYTSCGVCEKVRVTSKLPVCLFKMDLKHLPFTSPIHHCLQVVKQKQMIY